MNRLLLLVVILLAGCGHSQAFTRVSENTRIDDVISMFGDYGRLIFPVNTSCYYGDILCMTTEKFRGAR